jgi:hypothetical protein
MLTPRSWCWNGSSQTAAAARSTFAATTAKEMTADALRDCCRFSRAGSADIDLGSPWQNHYVESFGPDSLGVRSSTIACRLTSADVGDFLGGAGGVLAALDPRDHRRGRSRFGSGSWRSPESGLE